MLSIAAKSFIVFVPEQGPSLADMTSGPDEETFVSEDDDIAMSDSESVWVEVKLSLVCSSSIWLPSELKIGAKRFLKTKIVEQCL